MNRFLNRGQRPIVGAPKADAQARGRAAEELAARHLARQGVRILARNVHCRGGEIDLIGLHDGTLVFFEVRLRADERFGGAADSLTARKRRRVVLAARWWLAGAGRAHAERPCRFDAILLRALDETTLRWIRGAFDAD
ncbi:YraN family protein [Pseudothauera nasutitermitis]|uniref:UPF0102 protein E6C76_19835 n=1 Tax=Pseudothauera nasutitermitis TaxID=2565930 RepID=A0A4S4ARD4_9RHOO|nr:YraN family protein [Pseudothauera nasutitermitis]THF61909.1 YraN family protein [Pseudothauera nasutitermitis]